MISFSNVFVGCLPTTCTRFSPGVMCSGDTVFCIGSNVVAMYDSQGRQKPTLFADTFAIAIFSTMSGLQLSGTISTHIGVLTALSYLCGVGIRVFHSADIPMKVICHIIYSLARFHLSFLNSRLSPHCSFFVLFVRC